MTSVDGSEGNSSTFTSANEKSFLKFILISYSNLAFKLFDIFNSDRFISLTGANKNSNAAQRLTVRKNRLFFLLYCFNPIIYVSMYNKYYKHGKLECKISDLQARSQYFEIQNNHF